MDNTGTGFTVTIPEAWAVHPVRVYVTEYVVPGRPGFTFIDCVV
jgi:hypothetical protein